MAASYPTVEHKRHWKLWPDDARRDVLARLIALNRERAEDERRRGVAATKKRRWTRRKARRGKTQAPPTECVLVERFRTRHSSRHARHSHRIPNLGGRTGCRRRTTWSRRDDALMDKLLTLRAQRRAPSLPAEEASLLVEINRGVPTALRDRFDMLVERRRASTLTAKRAMN